MPVPFARLAALAVTGLSCLLTGTAEATGAWVQSPTVATLERSGLLRSEALDESSGLAVSRRDPFVFAINLKGELLGGYHIAAAASVDWEDIALGRCPWSEGDCLYVADTGDNSEKRDSVAIYAFREPEPPGPGVSPRVASARRLTVRYPDRPHDVESLAITPNGNLTLFTKGWRGGIIRFEIARAAWHEGSTTARMIGTLDIVPQFPLGRLATGAATSPSGNRLVLRTYTELYFFSRSANNGLVPDSAPCWLGAIEPQGEAVDFLDEGTVVLTSESPRGTPGPVYLATCPTPAESR